MRCYFTWDEQTQQKILIPFCFGSLHRNDKLCCTCPDPVKSENQSKKEAVRKEIKELTEANEILQKENNALIRIIEKLTKKQL